MVPKASRVAAYVPLLAAIAGCSTTGPAAETRSVSRVGVQLGGRTFLDDDFWTDVQNEGVLGLEISHVGDHGFGFELGGVASFGQADVRGNTNVTGAMAEVYAGLRVAFGTGTVRPYVGFGGALLVAGIDDDSGGAAPDDEATSPAIYAHGGLTVDISEAMYLGLDLRFVGGSELEFETARGDADYGQAALVLGARF